METTKQCALCKKIFEKSLTPSHLKRIHAIAVADYEKQFGKIIFPWTDGEYKPCNMCGKLGWKERWQIKQNITGEYFCAEHANVKQYENAICELCKTNFEIDSQYLHVLQKRQLGIYCSKTCSSVGKGRKIQVIKEAAAGAIAEKTRQSWKDPLIWASRSKGMKRKYRADRKWRKQQITRLRAMAKSPTNRKRAAAHSTRLWQTGVLNAALFPHGPDSHNWKGGHGDAPYPLEWRRAAKKIFKRDNYVCQDCGIETTGEPGLRQRQCHHIDRNKENLDPANLITLCSRCHQKRHSTK